MDATVYAPCPCCFESNGYEGSWHTDWDSGPYWWPSRTPCRECEGTGLVPCEVAGPPDEWEAMGFDDPGYLVSCAVDAALAKINEAA